MSGCGCDFQARDQAQRGVLRLLLTINGLMFLLELGAGLASQSTALLADSLDMAADAAVYGIGLYAVGRAATVKQRAARLSGAMQILLGLGVALDVLRRWWLGSDPEPLWMGGVGLLALAANLWCLGLLSRHRDGEVHMRASWIFSKNDVIANLGVIAAGGLVYWSGSHLPDLLIGAVISALVVRGGMQILAEARAESLGADTGSCCGG